MWRAKRQRETLKIHTWFEEICTCIYGVVPTWHPNLEKYIRTRKIRTLI